MMLRGSTMSMNSSSKNLSLSSSCSSVLPHHSSVSHVSTAQLKDRDDIESYLSVFQLGKSREKIDWAKLMDSEGENGDEGVILELEGATSTSAFLKPKATQASLSRGRGGDSVSVGTGDSGKLKYRKVTARGDNHHHLIATGVPSLKADSWNHDRSEALDTSSLSKEWTEQSDGFEEDTLHGSNSESDRGRHPLANVKTAGEFLMTDECQTFSERSAQLVTEAKSSAEVQDSVHDTAHSENEETGSESSFSEQFQLARNVFSIDQLETTLETHSDRTGTNENDSGLTNFRNLRTLDDLELDIHNGKNTEPVMSGREVTAGTKVAEKVFPRSPTTLGEGYSDEEFESVSSNSSDVVEEDIAEELSESYSNDIKTQKNVLSKSDHDYDQDITIDGSSPSMGREHSESVHEDRVSGAGGMGLGECKHEDTLWEDNHVFSEIKQHASGTSQESHTTSHAELSSSLDRTSTLNLDHSVGINAHKNKCQNTSSSDLCDALQTPSAAPAHVLPPRECPDPSPIVPHTTDPLGEVTLTSPAIVALNHLLRNQLALARQFIATSRHVTEQLSSGIASDHHYTTLEETKDYIAKHRPKVLTTKEAKKLVAMEALHVHT